MPKSYCASALLFAVAVTAAPLAAAQVAVIDPWVRGTVTGQKATGAFMQLKSAADASLVAAARSHQTISTEATISALPVMRVRIEVIEVSCGR